MLDRVQSDLTDGLLRVGKVGVSAVSLGVGGFGLGLSSRLGGCFGLGFGALLGGGRRGLLGYRVGGSLGNRLGSCFAFAIGSGGGGGILVLGRGLFGQLTHTGGENHQKHREDRQKKAKVFFHGVPPE